ncbi:hypothetical protein Tco_1386970 [Tanacetum coccineum]
MLAPSGGGLILYQAYGNLYAMTGRKAHFLEDKQIPSVGVFDEVFSTWMAFGGNTHDLGSFGEETDKITDLHQIHEEILFSKRGDGIAGIKQRRCDPSSDGIRDLVTASGHDQLNEDLESSTWRRSLVAALKEENRVLPRIHILDDQEEVSVQDPKEVLKEIFSVFFDVHSHEFIKFRKDFFFENSSLDGMKDFTPFIEKSIKEDLLLRFHR